MVYSFTHLQTPMADKRPLEVLAYHREGLEFTECLYQEGGRHGISDSYQLKSTTECFFTVWLE